MTFASFVCMCVVYLVFEGFSATKAGIRMLPMGLVGDEEQWIRVSS